MSALSGCDCPHCNVELYIEKSEEIKGVDLLICKRCWGVGVTAKSMDAIIPNAKELGEKKEDLDRKEGGCKCPICSSIMDLVELDIPENIQNELIMVDIPKTVIIDSCRNCSTFWFDAGELDLLNGIKPKLRGVRYDSELIRLIEDQSLSKKDLTLKKRVRQVSGGIVLLAALYLGIEGNEIMTLPAILGGIGGFIAIISNNPEHTLAKGKCDRCLKLNQSLAWNCQRGGCWAYICSDCESVGKDAVEQYAKTLGVIAGTLALGVLGIVALSAMAEGGGSGMAHMVGGMGSDGKPEEKYKSDMILCKSCMNEAKKDARAKKEVRKKMPNGEKEKRIEKLEEFRKKMPNGEKEKRIEKLETAKQNLYCDYEKCKRMVFRNSNYCYVHK